MVVVVVVLVCHERSVVPRVGSFLVLLCFCSSSFLLLLFAQPNVDVWQSILAVRGLVTPHTVDTLTWLKFVAICRDNGCPMLSLKTLVSLGIDSSAAQLLSLPESDTKVGDHGVTVTAPTAFDVCTVGGGAGGAGAERSGLGMSGGVADIGLSRSRLDSLGGVSVVIDAGQDRHVKFACVM